MTYKSIPQEEICSGLIFSQWVIEWVSEFTVCKFLKYRMVQKFSRKVALQNKVCFLYWTLMYSFTTFFLEFITNSKYSVHQMCPRSKAIKKIQVFVHCLSWFDLFTMSHAVNLLTSTTKTLNKIWIHSVFKNTLGFRECN